MKSLEKSYKKNLEQINSLRKSINDSLDLLEKNTKKELDTFLATIRASIQTDVENCTKSIKNITCLKEDLLRRKDKSEALSFMTYRKCLDQSLKVEAVLQEMTTKKERTLTFIPDTTIQKTLSNFTGLRQILSTVKQLQSAYGTTQSTVTKQDKPEVSFQLISLPQLIQRRYLLGKVSKAYTVIKVKSSKEYSVKMESDSFKCRISGIFETTAGELLITDQSNHRVKLLDQTYKVVVHCDLPDEPRSMCSIDSSQVAVATANGEVHFIRLNNCQLMKEMTLKLQHACYGIAHHQGNLYVTDLQALYHYTLNGRLVSKMNEETSRGHTGTACAVSPDMNRIYVAYASSTHRQKLKLVTLLKDGTVVSMSRGGNLFGKIQQGSPGLHVTDSGQVLVCGGVSNTILQVDRDGRQELAKNERVSDPTSVYYSKHTGSIIVGMYCSDNITVLEAQ